MPMDEIYSLAADQFHEAEKRTWIAPPAVAVKGECRNPATLQCLGEGTSRQPERDGSKANHIGFRVVGQRIEMVVLGFDSRDVKDADGGRRQPDFRAVA